jgi:pimeloyl-ACP methyl ester carboxylesterase
MALCSMLVTAYNACNMGKRGVAIVTPETRYAKSGKLSIAYQIAGHGPLDIVFVHGFVSNTDLAWETLPYAAAFSRLASIGRLIVFDKRGTGLSDRTADLPTLEERMDDVRAVMDAAGSERAVLVGISEGGPMSLLFAASYPERTAALVLWGTFARVLQSPEYRIGVEPAQIAPYLNYVERLWGTGQALRFVCVQDAPEDPATLRLFARYERNSATPAGAVAALRFGVETDVRHVLPAISAPTLVVHRAGDPLVPSAHGSYLATNIEGARFIEFPGDFHLSGTGADAALLDAIEEFILGDHPRHPVDRVLKTILFTDIIGSTAQVAALGDRKWRSLLETHDRIVRAEIERAAGQEVKTTGDGFLAAFDGPGRAIRCAQTIAAQARGLGIGVRAGLHTGECDVRGNDLSGIAVHIGARVAGLATGDDILVTSTVRDLVAGSGIEFDDRGRHTLRGVPGEWQILAVRG